MASEELAHCGYVAIVGKPNTGKSTLLNRIIGQKLSITSSKQQTTRHQILGIFTDRNFQSIYVDTPGIHRLGKKAINRYMNRAAINALSDIDVVVFVVEALVWDSSDDYILELASKSGKPVILVINKVDRIKDKEKLLPYISEVSDKGTFTEIVPVSAKKGMNVGHLVNIVGNHLPAGPFQFPEEQITDRSERFFSGEIIREKLMRRLGQELPYGLTAEIEEFKVEGEIIHIGAVIWTEKQGHKKIIIGKGGEMLKEIGQSARLDLEKFLDSKVNLRLWVKVREGWADSEKLLKSLGYDV